MRAKPALPALADHCRKARYSSAASFNSRHAFPVLEPVELGRQLRNLFIRIDQLCIFSFLRRDERFTNEVDPGHARSTFSDLQILLPQSFVTRSSTLNWVLSPRGSRPLSDHLKTPSTRLSPSDGNDRCWQSCSCAPAFRLALSRRATQGAGLPAVVGQDK